MTLPLTSPFTALAGVTKAQLDQLVNSINATIPVDTGWLTLSVTAANFSAGTPAPKYRAITWSNGSKLVSLTGVVQRSVAVVSGAGFNGTAVFAALPSGFRPSTFDIFTTWCATVGARVEMEVFTDGTIQFRNQGAVDVAANSNIGIDSMFFAG